MNTNKQEQTKGTEVRIKRNGPIKVVGKFTLTSVDGNPITPEGTDTMYLCACGRSKNKPFCDGSHNK